MLANDRYFYGVVNADGEKNKPDCIDHSKRVYKFNQNGSDKSDPTNNGREAYDVEVNNDGSLRFNLPVFTRAKNLIKQTAYSGNNLYENSTRTAYVKITVELDNGKPVEQIIRVVQVPRLTNPKGIYRKSGNNEDFNVVLMDRESATSTEFREFESDGPWIAEVLGDENFINLNGRKTIKGNTGSIVAFTVRFNKMNRDDRVRNAIIRVRYHNYSCVHLIFVRQGYNPLQISPGGPEWYTCNQIYGLNDIDGQDPRDEGSLFKFGNLTQAIDVKSNAPVVNAYKIPAESDFKVPESLYLANSDGSEPTDDQTVTWTGLKGNWPGVSNPNEWMQSKIASADDIETLYMTDNVTHGYGVLYADGATRVANKVEDAYGYYRYDPEEVRNKRGMRGLFVYYWDGNSNISTSQYNCNNVFFPLGRAGYGHRRDWDFNSSGQGVQRYCVSSHAEISNPRVRPQFFDLYRREGAVYWANNTGNIRDADKVYTATAIALDINYYTFDVSCLPRSNLQRHTLWGGCNDNHHIDACFVRKVK